MAQPQPHDPASVRDDMLQREKLLVVGKTYCPYTKRAKQAIANLGLMPTIIDLDTRSDGEALQAAFAHVSGMKTVPQVFIAGRCVGGCDATLDAIRDGSFTEQLRAAGVSV